MQVRNLHKLKDWENYYSKHAPLQVKTGFFSSYDIYLCDYLISKYIPRYNGPEGQKPFICEIGSGDGKLLEKFAGILNLQPIGIEYIEEIAKLAKKTGVETIIADAFDEKFIKKYKNYFDVVFSYGFVEHIIPPEKAITLHLDLVKPGGYFVVQIPRFKGFNYLRLRLFRPDLIKNHNLEIMNEDALEKLCKTPRVKKIYCKNYGTLKLRLPMENKNLKYYILKAICSLDYIINPTLRFLLKTRGFETYFFSPSVIFIGQKKK